jgi:hypothetical protein
MVVDWPSVVITVVGVSVGVGTGFGVGDGSGVGVGVGNSAVKMMSNCLRNPPLSNGIVVRAGWPLM